MKRAVHILLLAHCAMFVTTSAAAAEPTYDALVVEALSEFQASRWVEAYNLFKRAHELSDNARTMRGMGMTSYEMAEYPRALRELRAAIASEKKSLTQEQAKDAKELVERAERLVGTLEITVTPTSAQIFVNNRQTAGGEIVVKVGNVTIRAELAGYESVERLITVDGGKRYPITLALTSGGVVGAQPGPSPNPRGGGRTAGVASEPAQKLDILPIALLAGGGALIVAGSITGVMALGADADLDDLCGSNRQCAPEDDKARDDLAGDIDTLSLTTDILLPVGLLATGLGVYFLLEAPEEVPQVACGPTGCFGSTRWKF